MKPQRHAQAQETAQPHVWRNANHDEVTLTPFEAHVLRAVDAQRAPSELAVALGATKAQVWAALDRLADVNLLAGRVSPPSQSLPAPAVSRRDVLQKLAAAVGGAVIGSALVREARAEDARADSAREDTVKKRQVRLQEEQKKSQQEVAEAELRVREAEQKQKESVVCRADEQNAKQADRAYDKQCGDEKKLRREEEKAKADLSRARKQEEDKKVRYQEETEKAR
jgi:hypothetical protein